MNRSLITICLFFATVLSTLNLQVKSSERLYEIKGGGLYGGSSYKDSNGNYYNDSAIHGKGRYGGGVIVDKYGNEYHCSVGGPCTRY